MRALLTGLIAAMGLAGCVMAAELTAPTVAVFPKTPWIERTALGQALNFDFIVTNPGGTPVELVTVRAAVRDRSGAIARRLEINDNGPAPGIETMTARTLLAGQSRTVFNPFHTFAADVPLDRLDYELVFRGEGYPAVTSRLTVRPVLYRGRTQLTLPLRGRMLVWDGHDYISHHRRLDLLSPGIRQLEWRGNSSRYSLDLVLTDADGRMTRGEGAAKEDYYGYGQPVLAPAAGTVVRAFGQAPEGVEPPPGEAIRAFKANALAVFGNYVVIDHGDGEFSQLGHLRPGTLRVKVGQRVRAGEILAEVGASGASLFPHLHYQLVSSPDAADEGLPATFVNYKTVLGARTIHVARGAIDSGDIVEAR